MMPSPGREQDDASGAAPRSPFQQLLMRFRVLEFTVSFVIIGIAGILALISVHERPIPRVEVRISTKETVYARDPSIDLKKLDEQVPMIALGVAGVVIPAAVNLVMNYVLPKFKRIRVIPHDTRDFLLSLAQSVSISQLLTQFMKNMTGRFRPSFYDMCKWDYSIVWDGVTNLCQDAKGEKEGRKSFPSGHSSYSFATLFLLTLYLMGRSRLNCENRSETMLRGGRKTLKLFLCFLPTLVAAWVAITRSVDNWHHYSDILAGSIIGVLSAGFGYSYNYGSIFNWESAGVPQQEFHVRRKKKDRELAEASLTLLNSSNHHDVEPRSGQSHSTASFVTAPATAGKSDVVINVR